MASPPSSTTRPPPESTSGAPRMSWSGPGRSCEAATEASAMPLLGIDIGTSGTKTLLIDENGRVLASAGAEYPLSTPRPGWAEQDPRHWWDAARATVRAVLQQAGIRAEQVRGVGLSGQMHGS